MVSPKKSSRCWSLTSFSFNESVKLLLFSLCMKLLHFACMHACMPKSSSFPTLLVLFLFSYFPPHNMSSQEDQVTMRRSCHNDIVAVADKCMHADAQIHGSLTLKDKGYIKESCFYTNKKYTLLSSTFKTCKSLKAEACKRGKPVFQWSLPAIWCFCLKAPTWELIKKVCSASGTASSTFRTNCSTCGCEFIRRVTW